MKRSRNAMPLVEISFWLFGASSLSERLGAPDRVAELGKRSTDPDPDFFSTVRVFTAETV